jgi:hypothetical protein
VNFLHGPSQSLLDAATRALDPPFAVVDPDAVDAQAAELGRRAGGGPLRLAA